MQKRPLVSRTIEGTRPPSLAFPRQAAKGVIELCKNVP